MSLQELPRGRLLLGSAQGPPSSLLPSSGEICPQLHTARGSPGGYSSKVTQQPKLFCPSASKSFPGRGREITCPSPSMVCGFGYLGQGLHQFVAPRLALLCEVLERKEKVYTDEVSCPLICWDMVLWVSPAADASSQAHCDNTSAERRADLAAEGTDTQPRSSCVGHMHGRV